MSEQKPKHNHVPIPKPKSSRYDYIKYDATSMVFQESLKLVFVNLTTALENFPPSREFSLAVTKLEEAYMWIGKGIKEHQIARLGSAELNESRDQKIDMPPPVNGGMTEDQHLPLAEKKES
jgi:hypothetical protein